MNFQAGDFLAAEMFELLVSVAAAFLCLSLRFRMPIACFLCLSFADERGCDAAFHHLSPPFTAALLLRLQYPGWGDSALNHNESGFTVPTPFGDAMDVLLTDAGSWLLGRYAVVIVASELRSESSLRACVTFFSLKTPL